ncbi:hypothetical protein COCSUDRAFT_57220 [Coccomyxa subellipsoidea C-169]|uniref:Fe2OG dioxygenase domain-containing protein n=1 Tax=Coccomyxa subellipsoidea (strain C-169) TaxID=574566 RepID=I0YQI4_COCSC|nr:hypothetical protein COCSUDRAFT_57220 [Coccomyxa subellipsoidea C-169]EIE20653.1 hypothetical protein COCSUDRAFT_57220 [Coccomyxa subellipsoidea C-169]|eukprot:XP_005645197.1 hypothetical protein COCSUDRAFT_57220 [Coccomyxa subellipsoidea C-169]
MYQNIEKTGVDSLVTLAPKAIIERIKLAASGVKATFACGGSVKCPKPVRILFSDDGASIETQPKVLELPKNGDNASALENLVAACSAATFGKMNPDNPKEGADVLDLSYRKALKLDADCFDVNINLAELGILAKVKRLMAPDAADLRAELYKLNIHWTGDFFKAHVDTPRSADMLGSLVIALPCLHEGGRLTVEHGIECQTFDWSLTELPNAPLLQWGAFYSDCIHEVHPMTSGARITITYNLMAVKAEDPPLRGVNPSSLALRQILDEALQTDGFLEKGGTLAFGCQHEYHHNSDAFLDSHFRFQADLKLLLKGADACVVAVARDLGLKVDINPLFKNENNYEREYDSEGNPLAPEELERRRATEYVGKEFGLGIHDFVDQDAASVARLGNYSAAKNRGVEKRWDLIWCHGLEHHEVAEVYLAYGNEYSNEVMYSYAVILIEVPPMAQRKLGPASNSAEQ